MTTSQAARSLLRTLKRLGRESHALASLPDETLYSLFRSMTRGKRIEAIGELRRMNDVLGRWYVESLRTQPFRNFSRTECTTSRSSGGPSGSRSSGRGKTPCSYPTHFSPRVLKGSGISGPYTLEIMEPGRLSAKTTKR